METLRSHENPSERAEAARRLGDNGEDSEAYTVLCIALRDDDAWVRIDAAESLWRISPDLFVAIPALLGLLRHTSEELRRRARDLLEKMDFDYPGRDGE